MVDFNTAISLVENLPNVDEYNGDCSPTTRKYNRVPLRAFEVLVNGEKLCLAGIGEYGIVTIIVHLAGRHGEGFVFLVVGGLTSGNRSILN